jgi:glycosyltransferase involved in cell wall biosynthesis
MKILVVSQYFWPENFRINDLSYELVRRGHQVTVLTGLPNYPSGKIQKGFSCWRWSEKHEGMEIVRVPILPRGRGGGMRLVLNYLSFALSASFLGPIKCRGKYDLIFVHEPSPITVGLPAIAMKWLKGCPIIFWVLDLWPESIQAAGGIKFPPLINAVKKLVKFIYHQCDMILVQSRGFIPRVKSFGIPEGRIRYFPSWAEDIFKPVKSSSMLRIKLNVPERAFCIMFAGNVGSAQGFDCILEAAELTRKHPDIYWLVVGDGRMSSWLAEQVHEKGLQKNFLLLGRYPLDQMPNLYAMADVLLVSLKNEPIFSLTIPGKIQSYLASGKPVMAFLNGEGAKVVNESNAGLTCPGENPAALAEAVLKLYNLPPQKLIEMGKRGRVYYEKNFDRKMLFDRIENLMNETLKL